VNDRRARGLLRSVVSMMDILSGAVPLMGDVRQNGSGPEAVGLCEWLRPLQGCHRAREAGLKVQDHHMIGPHRDAAHPDA